MDVTLNELFVAGKPLPAVIAANENVEWKRMPRKRKILPYVRLCMLAKIMHVFLYYCNLEEIEVQQTLSREGSNSRRLQRAHEIFGNDHAALHAIGNVSILVIVR